MFDLENKKILLVRNDNIGDLICTTPAIEALRKMYTNNQIDIVVNSYNYDAIHKNPFINKIYCYTKPKHKSGLLNKIKAGVGKLKILLQIKKENYDVVVVFRSGYSKSAELFSNITNAQYKVGVKNQKGKDSFNLYAEVKNGEHEVEFCFNCLKEFGVEYDNENTFYHIGKKLEDKYKKYTDNILFHISSRIKENQYMKEYFKEIIENLDISKILVSAEPIDFEDAKWIAKNTKAKFIKTSSLSDLGGLIKNVKLFVTLDGGAMHLAPAVGTKTISISGKTNMDKWCPWGYKELVLKSATKRANDIEKNIIIDKIKENL